MTLCRELGKSLVELRDTVTDKELKLWYTLRLIEMDERKDAELRSEVNNDLEKNRGRWA
tara:strand:+ start:425 stop:601 length:177 start_codon:yes stop_codon:yes gene_type:complete